MVQIHPDQKKVSHAIKLVKEIAALRELKKFQLTLISKQFLRRKRVPNKLNFRTEIVAIWALMLVKSCVSNNRRFCTL